MFFRGFGDGRCGVGGTNHARRDRQGGSQSDFNCKGKARGHAEPRLRCQPSTAPDLGPAQTASLPR